MLWIWAPLNKDLWHSHNGPAREGHSMYLLFVDLGLQKPDFPSTRPGLGLRLICGVRGVAVSEASSHLWCSMVAPPDFPK